MKLHVLLIYLCAIVAGGILMVTMHRGTEVKLVATRELAANHLLQPGDLALSTGQAIRYEDLWPRMR